MAVITVPPPPGVQPFDAQGKFAWQWLAWFTNDIPLAIASYIGTQQGATDDDLQIQVAVGRTDYSREIFLIKRQLEDLELKLATKG
jgi:hypothetical protein